MDVLKKLKAHILFPIFKFLVLLLIGFFQFLFLFISPWIVTAYFLNYNLDSISKFISELNLSEFSVPVILSFYLLGFVLSCMGIAVFTINFIRLPIGFLNFNLTRFWSFLFIDKKKTIYYFFPILSNLIFSYLLIQFRASNLELEIIESASLSTIANNGVFSFFFIRKIIKDQKESLNDRGQWVFSILVFPASIIIPILFIFSAISSLFILENEFYWKLIFLFFLLRAFYDNWKFCELYFENILSN